MLLDDQATQANLLRGWAAPLPPADPSGFSLGSFLKAGATSPVRGMFDWLGNVADFNASDGINDMRRPGDAGIRSPQDDARAAAARQAWKQTASLMRSKADQWSPDPATAHRSEQVISGLGSGVSKAVGSIMTLGPAAGAALFGLGEGDTAYQRLLDKGIDPAAAAKVAAVTGVAAGAGAVIPMAGSTVAKTLGLVGVGGPGLYVAQETLARNILQKAGAVDEAKTHDPTDPLGLALSLAIPGVFGALHIRNLAKQADAVKALALNPAEQAHNDAYERSAINLAELQKAVAAEKNPENRAALQSELDKQTAEAAKHTHDTSVARAATDPAIVDAARVKVAEDTLQASLPAVDGARAAVMRAADDLGAGRMPDVEPMIAPAERDANFKAWFGDSKVMDDQGAPLVLYRGRSRDYDVMRRDAAESMFSYGNEPDSGGLWFHPDAAEAQSYVKWGANYEAGANVMPVYARLENPARLESNHRDFEAQARELRAVEAAGHDGAVFSNGDVVVFRPEQIKSAIGNSGRFDPNSASLTDPLPPRVPRATAAEPTGANQLPDPASITAEPAKPAGGATEPGALPALDSARLKSLADESPDMLVTLPGHDEPMRLADALEAAKQEADLIKTDAQLLRVAVTCALQNGAMGAAA